MSDRLTDDARLWRVIVASSIALFAINLDFFAVQAALPRMARDLDSNVTSLQWVLSGYMLALASCLIVGGRVADLLGRRRWLVIGAALFGLASLLAGAADSGTTVILLRIAQGAGAAVLFPVCLSVVTNAFPADRTQRAIGTVFAIAAIGQALGPFVGGAVTEFASWRWVLWINVPVSCAVIVLTLTSVEESRDETAARRIDWAGLVLVIGSVGLFTYGIDRSGDLGWSSPTTIAPMAIGAIGLGAFLVVESRSRVPLIDLGLFRIREFSLMIAAGVVGNMGVVVVIFLSMLLLQNVEGFTAIEAGAAFLAFSGGITLASQLSGHLERFPSWLVMTAALVVGGAAAIGMGLLHDDVVPYLVLSAFAGFGLGMCWTFASVVTQAVAPPEKAGAASGIVLTLLIGMGGVAVAVATSIVEGQVSRGTTAEGSAIGIALIAFGGLAVVSAPVVAVLGRRQPAPLSAAGS